MRTVFRTIAATVGFTTLALTAGVGVAAAQPFPGPRPTAPVSAPTRPAPQVLEVGRARCLAEADRRLASIQRWKVRVEAARRVSADGKAGLLATLDGVAAGISGTTRPAIVAATTPQALDEACRSLVNDYRVYAVLGPSVALLAGADAGKAGVAKLTEISATLAAAGADVTQLNSLVEQAGARFDAVAGKLSSVTAASYNADPSAARATIRSARQDVVEGGKLLRQATRLALQLRG